MKSLIVNRLSVHLAIFFGFLIVVAVHSKANRGPFAGSDCDFVDLCDLRNSGDNCTDGNKVVLKAGSGGVRKQFLLADSKTIYGWAVRGKKFPECSVYAEKTSTIKCKYVSKSDVAGISLSNRATDENISVAYKGEACEWVDICSMRTKGTSCSDGSKFVLKAGGGVRKQFLFTNGKIILAFVTKGEQFASCSSFTEVTSSVECKVVDGLSSVFLNSSTEPTTSTTATTTWTTSTTTSPEPTTSTTATTTWTTSTTTSSEPTIPTPTTTTATTTWTTTTTTLPECPTAGEVWEATSPCFCGSAKCQGGQTCNNGFCKDPPCTETDIDATTGHYSCGSVSCFNGQECDEEQETCTYPGHKDNKCGRPRPKNNTRIQGGSEAKDNLPWMAALTNKRETFCGATLIANQWLATSGHCLKHVEGKECSSMYGHGRCIGMGDKLTPEEKEKLKENVVENLRVVLGVNNIQYARKLRLRDYWIHPLANFRLSNHPSKTDHGVWINDIGLIKLDEMIKEDQAVPICLPDENTDYSNDQMLNIYGWGAISLDQSYPYNLQELSFRSMTDAECRDSVKYVTDPIYILTNCQLRQMLCGRGNQKGPCTRDSGGPYSYIQDNGQHILAGVVSWSLSSEKYCNIGVHGAADTSSLRGWIDAHIHLHDAKDSAQTTRSEVKDHPWLARLSTTDSSEDIFCSGALLFRQWVITTASCVKDRTKSDIFVILGDHTETVPRRPLKVTDIFSNQLYDETCFNETCFNFNGTDRCVDDTVVDCGTDHITTVYENDVALLKLATSIDIDQYPTVSLPVTGTDYTGEQTTYYGHSTRQKDAKASPTTTESSLSSFSTKISGTDTTDVTSSLAACKLRYQEKNKECKAACKAQQDAGTMPKGCKKNCNARKKEEVAANCPSS